MSLKSLLEVIFERLFANKENILLNEKTVQSVAKYAAELPALLAIDQWTLEEPVVKK